MARPRRLRIRRRRDYDKAMADTRLGDTEESVGVRHWTEQEIAAQWPSGYDAATLRRLMRLRFGFGTDQRRPLG